MAEEITNEEINENYALGALASSVDVRDYTLTVPDDTEFPEEFELEMCDVKSQGSVGSCVAHSLAEVIEYYNRQQEHTNKQMSVGFIYGNRFDTLYKGTGMYVREALSAVRKSGDVYFEDFPYNKEVPDIITEVENAYDSLEAKAYPNRISGYIKLKTDDEIKYALMNCGPVVFAMTWKKGFKVNSDGILTLSGDDTATGGHCMVIYGWNKNGWKIQNSWGKLWGKAGTAILPYDFARTETWAVVDEIAGEKVQDDIVKPFSDNVFKKKVAIVLNAILNFFKNLISNKKV